MNILGINAFHGDASAALVVDGQLVYAVEEERFTRMKHCADFPAESIKHCLASAGLTISDIDHVAVSKDPKANLMNKVLYGLRKSFSLSSTITNRLKAAAKALDLRDLIAKALDVDRKDVRAKVHNVEHHLAHMASAFYISPFSDAAILSIDGFGDFVSTKLADGHGNDINVLDQVLYPHSMGIFYTACTQFAGFTRYGDEGKMMGLGPCGDPVYLDKMRDIVNIEDKELFTLNLDYFLHHKEGVAMTWEKGAPTLGTLFSGKFVDSFGPPREPGSEYTKHYRDFASSTQALYEEVLFHIANRLHEQTKSHRLCLAGGVALNSCGNGKLSEHTPFTEFYIQPAAGDNGTSVGAAFYAWNKLLGKPRTFVMTSACTGPEFDHDEIGKTIDAWLKGSLTREHVAPGEGHDVPAPIKGTTRVTALTDDEVFERTASAIADGKVVGWFQGRMEFGPRALGNRSIVADPRRADMKDILNSRIKHRESFRPFAPSMLEEATSDYFEKDHPSPHMLMVYKVREDKRDVIPAVTHVDGTGRLQTVTKDVNERYYRLIKAFKDKTGVPVVLNTSFNENEPIVGTPADAIHCFVKTGMDVIVLGNWFIERLAHADEN